jgi:hypothetical protein
MDNKIFCNALNLFTTKTKFHSQTSYLHDNRKCRKVRNALFEAGQTLVIDCSFSSKGIGTYMGNENSDPQPSVLNSETAEIKIEVTFENI